MELLWAVKRKKSRESSRSRKGRSSGVLKRRHEAGESSRSSRSDKSSRRHSSRTRRNSRRSSRSRRRRSRQKSSRRSKSHRSHRCTINASRCPHRMSDVRLRQAAQRDRWRRLDASVAQMVQAFSLTEPKMLRAMERQKAYNGMRLLALYLEIVCIVITGVMGIFAQQMFNTRGGLDFYVFQMTAELILLTIVITNVTSPGTVSRFLNVIFFIIGVTCDFSHILLHIQRRGAYFKCTESDKLVQHCLWNIIPTHHHLLYTSGLLLLFHLAIVMVNVSAAVFYGGSLDHYQDKTPGKPEWVTNLPLHLHDKIDAARRLKPKARAFRLEDLPPGTTITREQEEQSVQYTTIGRDGSKKERPHDVTVTRRFTIKAPGIGSATGTRSWKAQKSSSLTDLTPGRQPKSNPRDNAIGVPNQWQPQHNQNGGAMFECPCGGPGEDLRASSGADQKGCPFEFPCGGTAEGPRTGAGKDPKTKTGRRSILSKVMQLLRFVVCAGLATALPHLGKRTNYDEMLARKLLNMAASAYGEQEEECINRTYPAFEGYKVLSSSKRICDDFNNTCRGYIAASHVNKELLIVFRGTEATGQLLLQGLYAISPLVKFFGMGSVHAYFLNGHFVLWPPIERTLNDANYAGYRVTITGHSLGGALAALAAARIVKQGFRRGDQITIYTFGEPRVGDHTFATNFDSMIKNSYRVVFRRDLVPHLPACANDQSWFGEGESNQTCDVNVKGKPYHHSTEIWYPYSMKPGSIYMECTGQPTGEDFTCSDKIRFYLERLNSYIWDHKHYFTVRVSQYGRFGCDHTRLEGKPGLFEKVMCLLNPNPDCWKHKVEARKHMEVVPSELVNVAPPPSNEFSKKQSVPSALSQLHTLSP